MPCDEAFYRHFHKKQNHTHDHKHEEHNAHPHERKEEVGQKTDFHQHVHEETLHAHPYQHDDLHHQPEALQVGVSVYVLEDRKEQLILEDVDLLEFDDDQIVVHNILGKEQRLTARLKRFHFVERGKALMLLERTSVVEQIKDVGHGVHHAKKKA